MRWTTGLMVLAMLLTTALPASAQPGPPPGAGPPAGAGPAAGAGPGVKQRVRLRLLQRRVGLDDATAQKVIEVLRAHEGKRDALAERMKTEKQTLGRLVREDGNDEAAYRTAIDALMRTQQEMEALRVKEFTELRKVLTAKQQAKLLFELNRLMKRRQQGAGLGPGPGAGPCRGAGCGPPPGRGPRRGRGNR